MQKLKYTRADLRNEATKEAKMKERFYQKTSVSQVVRQREEQTRLEKTKLMACVFGVMSNAEYYEFCQRIERKKIEGKSQIKMF